ncbi:MAG: YihY/virulence factor BrkB family protein [Candidatus Jettenia sp. CY-1]|nr:MAG: YihY/virulence factor BrkB family protein [Candidatus Jettenia sp. CY-1]
MDSVNPLVFYNKIKRFISVDIWADVEEPSASRRFFRKLLKVCLLTVREFTDGQWPLKASALTFVSLISLVPFLAFILSISKGLGAEKVLNQKIDDYIIDLPGGKMTSSVVRFKQRLLTQIDMLNFTDPSSKNKLLNTIESFDTVITLEDKVENQNDFPKGERAEDIPVFSESSPSQNLSVSKEELKTAIENFESELFEAVNSVNFSEEDAKKKLREDVELTTLSVPTNISLNALHYKSQIMHFIEKTSFGYLGAIGLFSLIFIIIRALGTIEMSFNDIWKIKKSRSIFRKFSNYISMLIIIPMLLLASTTITAALTNAKLVAFLNKIWVGEAYLSILKWLLPIAVLWIAFIAAYILVPNTRVKFIPGIIGGLVGGTIFHLLQIFYFRGQASVADYNVIYGAFAAIPFFLLWLQTSWIVILFGAELSFVIQNIKSIKMKGHSIGINYASRELLGLMIMGRIASQFLDGKTEKWSDEHLSEELNVPIGVIQGIILELLDASLVIEIPAKQNVYYMPARDLNSIYVNEVLHAMRSYGEHRVPVKMTHYDKNIIELIGKTRDIIKNNLQFTIKDIILKTDVEKETPPPSSTQ